MQTVRSVSPFDPTFMIIENKKEAGGMRTPHRRDISARQDLLGRELRELFDDYTQEDMPDELLQLAQQLQSAFEGRDPKAEKTEKADKAEEKAIDGADRDTADNAS